VGLLCNITEEKNRPRIRPTPWSKCWTGANIAAPLPKVTLHRNIWPGPVAPGQVGRWSTAAG